VARTWLKKLNIRRFRALSNVEIELGTCITAICGKNGTSKSSILGIAAQIFSFEKDYVRGQQLTYQTVSGGNFKSPPSEHFRFSDRFDTPGSLDVAVDLHDGYTDSDATAELELSSRTDPRRGVISRPVVRKNSTVPVGENTSRNFTHPVIFLSLKRLLPIADRKYTVENFAYLQANQPKFLSLNNELLNKVASVATGTGGSISSAVAHGNTYDQESVSAGEDNVGQIAMALMSFRKLREEYADYAGGLLLIDEADAALFPAAQLKLIDVLERECSELHVQVVMTSHSPALVERVFDLSQKYRRKFKTYYLSDTFGPVRAQENISWTDIYADLHTATVAAAQSDRLPRVNVYFEDREGYDFFSALVQRQPVKKFIHPLPDVTLGCGNYLQLIRKGVPEFAQKSVVILDADVAPASTPNAVVILPGSLPPDQLLFEFLYNLPATDPIWQNTIRFNRPVLTQCAAAIIGRLNINSQTIDLSTLIEQDRQAAPVPGPRLRDLFKDFYKDAQFQLFLKTKGLQNPWRRWLASNPVAVEEFRTKLKTCVSNRMREGFGADLGKVTAALH
jgi:ABC-type cobalamin/Fe3+-siderophores transport system ATPase subunit